MSGNFEASKVQLYAYLFCLGGDVDTTVFPVALDARSPVSALASAGTHHLSSQP